MAAPWTKIWDQTAVNRGGAGVGGRPDYTTPTRGGILPDGTYVTADNSAAINPNYYGNPNNSISQIRAFEKNKQITGRTPLEQEAIKQYGGAQVANMSAKVQQAIAEQENALAYHIGGRGTPRDIRNPYTNPNLSRGEQDAIAAQIAEVQQSSTLDGMPPSPKAIHHVNAFMRQAEHLSVEQKQVLAAKMKADPEIGPHLAKVPGWRQFDEAAQQEFMQFAQSNLEKKRALHPDVPPEIWQVDPKTGQAVRNDDDYAVWKDGRILKEREQKQRIEQSKPLFEAIQKAQDASDEQGWFRGSGKTNAALESVRMQARIADMATGGSTFSDAIAGASSPQDMVAAVMSRMQNPAQSQPQTPPAGSEQEAAPPAPVAAGIADMAESRLTADPEAVVKLPNGRKVAPRKTPFSGGQFSIPDAPSKPVIKQSASQPKRGTFVFDVEFGGKQYAVPAHIKAALEENPAIAKNILSSFEKKNVAAPPKMKPQSRAKPKPIIEWQGKSYRVSEAMAEAARKSPELTQYFIGAK